MKNTTRQVTICRISSSLMTMMTIIVPLLLVVSLLVIADTTHVQAMATSSSPSPLLQKVAVIGTTGRLGRQVVMKLSEFGIPTKCLLRHDISKDDDSLPIPSKDELFQRNVDSKLVARYLNSLPNVEMIQGDVTNPQSVEELLQDCTACLAVYGARRISKLSDVLPWTKPSETDPTHSKQVNYEGVRNIINAARKESSTCKRIVRITGTQSVSSWHFSFFLVRRESLQHQSRSFSCSLSKLLWRNLSHNNANLFSRTPNFCSIPFYYAPMTDNIYTSYLTEYVGKLCKSMEL